MKYTEKLNLPIYDTPETDLFKIQDWNNGNTKIEQAYGEMLSYNEAENQRILSEQERVSNEASRVSNENTRVLNENTRVQKEEERRIKEEERKQEHISMLNAEALRKTEESNRVASENARIQAENLRVSKEDERKTKETERQSNETLRISKETERQNKETQRLSAEEERKSNEIARQTVYKEIEDARKDFNGVVRDNLSERLTSDMSYINDRFNNATLLEYDNKYISATKTYDGVTKDLKIKGKTLQNLYNTSYKAECVNQKVTFYYLEKALCETSLLKPNTTYTLAYTLNVKEDTTNGKYTVATLGVSNVQETLQKELGVNKHNLDTSIGKRQIIMTFNVSDFYGYKYLILRPIRRSATITEEEYITVDIDSYMIIEGDYTNENISYFEGIKSVGEEGNLDVVSCGKNLVNPQKCKLGFFYEDTIRHDGNFCIAELKVKKGEKYICSDDSFYGVLYDENYKYIETVNRINNTFTTKNEGIVLIRPHTSIDSETTPYKSLQDFINKFQIEISEVQTPYEPYKETRIPITLTEPLRGLPNGVCDEIDLENGKIIRRVGKYTFSGNEDIYTWGTSNSPTHCNCYMYTDGTNGGLRLNVSSESLGIGICNSLPIVANTYSRSIKAIGISKQYFSIGLPLKELNLTTENSENDYEIATKNWLKSNPTIVYYMLETPIEEDIVLPNNIRTYDGTTNIFTEGNLIEPNVYCKIPSDVIALTDIRNSTVKSKIFANADARVEELEQDVKNIVTQEAWIKPTLVNGWTEVEGYPVGYYKDSNGIVRVRGRITGGTNTHVFNLPSGYRPLTSLGFPIISTTSTIAIGSVGANGEIRYYGASNLTIALDVISFRVEK